jgi:hypothetical protein
MRMAEALERVYRASAHNDRTGQHQRQATAQHTLRPVHHASCTCIISNSFDYCCFQLQRAAEPRAATERNIRGGRRQHWLYIDLHMTHGCKL